VLIELIWYTYSKRHSPPIVIATTRITNTHKCDKRFSDSTESVAQQEKEGLRYYHTVTPFPLSAFC